VDYVGIVLVILTAMGFNYTNGFHDAANAIATSVSTRALTPRVALAMAAVFNLIGSFLGAKVANTVGKGIIDLPNGSDSLVIVFAALIGAISWNLLTWYFGLPSSSSHALIGGLVGAAIASSSTIFWHGIYEKVLIPMILSPVVGLVLGYFVMTAILWIFRKSSPSRVSRGFRHAQSVSAAAMSLGHGMQDAAKTMGVIVLALNVGGFQDDFDIPIWVFFMTAAVLAAGTYSGGWRIMRTLGRRIIHVDPARGFSAEATGAAVLYVMAILAKAPVSTTHTITSAIMGAGATKRFSAVRWGVARSILVAWVSTFPAAGAMAALVYLLLKFVFRLP
jgi:PiT family inorganic phosphate transporter